MPPTASTVDRPEAAGRELDAESLGWLTALRDSGAVREQGIADLHAVLLRIARSETHRRSGRLHISGPELDDLGHQAADDALLAIIAKLEQFRGESRFTTWACTFVIVEVSTKIGRHFWRTPTVALDAEDWDRLPDRFGLGPAHHAQARELVDQLLPIAGLVAFSNDKVDTYLDGTLLDSPVTHFLT